MLKTSPTVIVHDTVAPSMVAVTNVNCCAVIRDVRSAAMTKSVEMVGDRMMAVKAKILVMTREDWRTRVVCADQGYNMG